MNRRGFLGSLVAAPLALAMKPETPRPDGPKFELETYFGAFESTCAESSSAFWVASSGVFLNEEQARELRARATRDMAELRDDPEYWIDKESDEFNGEGW